MKAKYLTVAEELERELPRRITAGNTRLPPEEELCRRFGCSRVTIREALRVLQEKKLIIKRKGSGTYISATASKGRVVLLLPGSGEYIYPAMVKAAARFFEPLRLELSCRSTENRILRERELLEELLREPPAGLLLYPSGPAQPGINGDLLQKLTERGVPVVALQGSGSLPAEAVTVAPDLQGGCYSLTLPLLRKGNERLKAVLPVSAPGSAEQFAGLMRAAAEHGAGFGEEDILWLSEADLQDLRDSRYGRLSGAVRRSIPAGSTVFCGNDELAYHLLLLLKSFGRRVPEEVSLIGCDNSYLCTVPTPALSSLGTEKDAVTEAACRALLQLMTGGSASSQRLPMKLFVRESTRRD